MELYVLEIQTKLLSLVAQLAPNETLQETDISHLGNREDISVVIDQLGQNTVLCVNPRIETLTFSRGPMFDAYTPPEVAWIYQVTSYFFPKHMIYSSKELSLQASGL